MIETEIEAVAWRADRALPETSEPVSARAGKVVAAARCAAA
jgi:hypothetical protein